MRCEPAPDFSVAKAIAWRSAIDDDPAYQRAGDVWSLAQRQLFIDSLLNGYDVPKIYLHDLRGRHPTKVYAVVDGRQRLTALWAFVRDEFPLAATFRVEDQEEPLIADPGAAPSGPVRFSEMDPRWRTAFLRTPLSVVLIRGASEADIEELFARLNNGVALSDPERRNASGGAMAGLIRDVAASAALFGVVGFDAARGAHLDLAARLLAWEDARRRADLDTLDVSPAGLDAFVRQGRTLPLPDRVALTDALERDWERIASQFRAGDPRLSAPDDAFRAVRSACEASDGGRSGERPPAVAATGRP